MQKERISVLLDTNVLISGLVFERGNEHRILQLIEQGAIDLVLPETVLIEAKQVLREKFEGLESLLRLYLDKIDYESVKLHNLMARTERDAGKVRDQKDTSIYSADLIAKPNYVVTGDLKLRADLIGSIEISKNTKTCSSREFLQMWPHSS